MNFPRPLRAIPFKKQSVEPLCPRFRHTIPSGPFSATCVLARYPPPATVIRHPGCGLDDQPEKPLHGAFDCLALEIKRVSLDRISASSKHFRPLPFPRTQVSSLGSMDWPAPTSWSLPNAMAEREINAKKINVVAVSVASHYLINPLAYHLRQCTRKCFVWN